MIASSYVQLVQRSYEREEMLEARNRTGRVVRSRMSYHLDPSLRDRSSEGDDVRGGFRCMLGVYS